MEALFPTICQHCGGRDSLGHFAERVNICAAPLHDRGDLELYLAELSRRAHNVNPGYPVPLLQGDEAEVGIHIWSDSECGEGEEGEPQLDFDDDVDIGRALLCGDTGEMEGRRSSVERDHLSVCALPLGRSPSVDECGQRR